MSNSTIGWQAGPTERGTLTLVYGCLITIFTCTWTVLHLNVPGLHDKWWEVALRKAKWMAITILLPEFIFAKAVCDLRMALQNLHEFDNALKEKHKDNLKWIDSDKSTEHIYSWQVDYGPRAKLLYKTLGLTPPDDQSRPIEKIAEYEGETLTAKSSPDAEGAQAYPTTTPIYRTVQLWTLTHAYFANMGGLVYSGKPSDRYQVLTGTTLSVAYSWDIGHPLRGLILGREDIEDKSKADWLLKCLAVLQVTWLVLTVIVRGASGLPVTQLEIATVAFSISAIATYAANWWKPKDVSQAIRIPKIAEGRFDLEKVIIPHRFTLHITDFLKAKDDAISSRRNPQYRVPNDATWINGSAPLIYNIMAVFSVIFGGIHLIAWNFDFPSLAELMLWRASGLTSTILLLIIIMPNLYLNYLATTYTTKKLESSLLEMLRSLDNDLVDFWGALENLHSSLGGENERNTPPTRTSSSSFNERPLNDEEDRMQEAITIDFHELNSDDSIESKLRRLTGDLLGLHTFLEDPRNTERKGHLSFCVILILKTISDELLNEYENYCNNNSITHDTWNHVKDYVLSFVEIARRYNEELIRSRPRRETYFRVSKFLTIGGSILYIISRLIIIVLLFTSLRAVPKGVYDNTPWTRFLPNFS
ncbi:hypothetical protein F4860DRAFT_159941 [Xylaria cubensis]|nr:hypothetical protein F4860DRAFT_159941 [Xylaria cubensis]